MKKYLVGLAILIFGVGVSFLVLKKGSEKGQTLPATACQEAWFYEKLDGGRVQCQLCPNRCILTEGQRGLCKVRENQNGKLVSLVYGQPVTIHVDPIEKKPFNHFLPGSTAYSIATGGCSLSCKYCQNWDIAQRFPEDLKSINMPPEKVVEEALKSGAKSIAYTYSEPMVFYEYLYDTAKLAHERGLKNVVVSSGYVNPEPLKKLLPLLDAIKIDLKGFSEDFYQEIVGGHLQPVLDNLKIIKEEGTWLEIVNLLVPGKNDNPEEIKKMCEWLKNNLGPDVPLHFSRFHPEYKLQNLPPTPEETVKNARQICLDVGLHYVYTGNIIDPEGQTTYCPTNKKPLIVRQGQTVLENHLDEGLCDVEVPGVWR